MKEIEPREVGLVEAGADITGASYHGVSHSLCIRDPDGIELELYEIGRASCRERV